MHNVLGMGRNFNLLYLCCSSHWLGAHFDLEIDIFRTHITFVSNHCVLTIQFRLLGSWFCDSSRFGNYHLRFCICTRRPSVGSSFTDISSFTDNVSFFSFYTPDGPANNSPIDSFACVIYFPWKQLPWPKLAVRRW